MRIQEEFKHSPMGSEQGSRQLAGEGRECESRWDEGGKGPYVLLVKAAIQWKLSGNSRACWFCFKGEPSPAAYWSMGNNDAFLSQPITVRHQPSSESREACLMVVKCACACACL